MFSYGIFYMTPSIARYSVEGHTTFFYRDDETRVPIMKLRNLRENMERMSYIFGQYSA